jgi:hypothetical protein
MLLLFMAFYSISDPRGLAVKSFFSAASALRPETMSPRSAATGQLASNAQPAQNPPSSEGATFD